MSRPSTAAIRWMVAAALATGLGAAPARAEPTAPPVSIAAAVRRGDQPVTAAILVGAGGQLYRPSEPGVWRRDALGGVAIEVVGAILGPTVLYAVGRGTPLFRYAARSWHVDPLPNRGPIAFSQSGLPTIAIGRQLYLLSRDRFSRVATVQSVVTAIWAASNKRFYLAGDDGKLRRLDGKQASEISNPLPATDRITALVGIPGKQLIAIAASGALLDVGARSAKPIATAPTLAKFHAVLACPDLGPSGDGAIFAVGTVVGDGGSRWLLARVQRGRLEAIEELADPGSDDFTVLLADPTGGLLLATRRGQLRLRAADGQWTGGQVSGEPPPTAPPTGAGRPGRSR